MHCGCSPCADVLNAATLTLTPSLLPAPRPLTASYPLAAAARLDKGFSLLADFMFNKVRV